MKKKITFILLVVILMISPVFLNQDLYAQTAGTFTCSYTTVSTGGYTPKNVIAVWIETNSGTFVKTKLKYCSNGNLDHLATWTGKSGLNVVDAITGSTRTANGAMTFVWNGTDVSATLVADGTYKVWIEFAWASSLTTGKTVEPFSFTKGATADHQTPVSSANITGITLDWVPAGVGIIEKQDKEIFSVSPNPINNQTTINYSLIDLSDVTISLYDVTGKLMTVLSDGNQNAGNYSLPLNLKAKVKPGVYFVKMNTGKTQHTERVLLLE